MESNLVAEFVAKTGVSTLEAHNYLIAKKWDLKQAIQDYLSESKENSIRPVLTKSEAFDDNSYKKLSRGISRATDNACVVSRARTALKLDFKENGIKNVDQHFIEAPMFTFSLPDFFIYPDDFREFLERDLIEQSCLTSLEQAGRLNWWVDNRLCPRLWPLSTTGDGNCLLHAASLGMWGFHDRLLILRKALHELLTTSSCREALWRRWRWQLTLLNAEAGLVYTEEEWQREWDAIVNMASSAPRNSGRRRSMLADKSTVAENATYESLEEIHVLALAHVLKRTIIVIADTMLKDVNGENLAPILFGGIYLPLEIEPSKCHRHPLVLSYDAAHFSALVTMDNDKSSGPQAVIPLTDSSHRLLPVQFVVDPGEDFVWGRDELLPVTKERLTPNQKSLVSLLREYLDIVFITLTSSPSSEEYEDMDTPGDEEDIEKRFCEVDEDGEDQTDSAVIFGGNRSRLQNVAKSFGSIGKSMSKKLKKNLGTITKMTRGTDKRDRSVGQDSTPKPDYFVTARLGSDSKPDYLQEMVNNYLCTARTRFERECAGKSQIGTTSSELERLQVQAKLEGPKHCITPGCNMFATAVTSYLCSHCYDKQRQQELSISINSPHLPRHAPSPSYGTGKSTFYVEPAITAASGSSTINGGGVVMRNKFIDDPPSMHLNRSTFYANSYYPSDSFSSSATNRSTMPPVPAFSLSNNLPAKRNNLQEVGNAIDSLGQARYQPSHRTSALSDINSRDVDLLPPRNIHSYNLSREVTQPNKTDALLYNGRRTSVRSTPSNSASSRNSTSTTMSPQTSQDMPEIENVVPSRMESERRLTSGPGGDGNRPVARIIPIAVEGTVHAIGGRSEASSRNCLNVSCHYYGSPASDNYCSQCFKGKEALSISRLTH